MKIYLDNNLGVSNVEQEELTQDTIGYNILKVYIPNAVLTPYDTFTCYYGALLQNGRKVGWFAMEARTSTDADYEANYTLYKATLEQCVVSVEGKVYIGCQVLLGNSGNATLIKKNTAVVQFNVRKSVAINNDILVLDPDQTNTDVLESYKNLLENALTTYATKATTYTKTEVNSALALKADKSDTYTKQESDNKFAPKSTDYVKHDGNQLKDSNGNNIYPNVDTKTKAKIDNAYGPAYVGEDTSTNILAKTSNKGIWIGSDTGKWYYWNGSQYVEGGVYQSSAIADGSITDNKLYSDLRDKINSIGYSFYTKRMALYIGANGVSGQAGNTSNNVKTGDIFGFSGGHDDLEFKVMINGYTEATGQIVRDWSNSSWIADKPYSTIYISVKFTDDTPIVNSTLNFLNFRKGTFFKGEKTNIINFIHFNDNQLLATNGKTYEGSSYADYKTSEYIDVSNFENFEFDGYQDTEWLHPACFYDVNKNLLSTIYSYAPNVITANSSIRTYVNVPTNAKYFRFSTYKNDVNENPVFYAYQSLKNKIDNINFNSYRDVYIAAKDATLSEKLRADIICDGINDEEDIRKACINIGNWGTIHLSSGHFYFDSFYHLTSQNLYACVPIYSYDVYLRVNIVGAGIATTIITVTESAMQSLGTEVGNVFYGYVLYSTNAQGFVNYKDFSVYLNDNQHKVTVINNCRLSGGICEHLRLSGVLPNISNTQDTPIATEECVGITGFAGDCAGYSQEFKHCVATGFREAFRLGGEHLVCTELNARFNYYAYTFGKYNWVNGRLVHPLTLINCCDEHSVCLPLFYANGSIISGMEEPYGMQEINFISFNLEISNYGGVTQPARETQDGMFCGRIDFTANGDADWSKNLKNVQFWANGSGSRFRTTNMTHKLGGTTQERNSYTPMYMQHYFDTDLSKELIYNGTQWVDCNGNVV